jgi:hypothetical protein
LKYGDFSSLVQLGVGLHAGTALLQLYGEFGLQPIERAIARVRDVLEPQDVLHEQLAKIEAELAIFKIQLFNEYKRHVRINFVVAIILTLCLVYISFFAEEAIDFTWALIFFALSCLPAPVTLLALWHDASNQIRPLRGRLTKLEDSALRSAR